MINTPIVARHRTALARTDYSRPIRQALHDEVLRPPLTVLDYGCGLGGDVVRLSAAGFNAVGWDPNHRPDGPKRASDVVNLGYVVNVIEDVRERAAVLSDAWGLAGHLLIVAARLRDDAKSTALEAFEDGGLTRIGTFQKFFDQAELREWIDGVLGVSCVAAAPGMFYVFRQDEQRESFLARRHRRRLAAPRLSRSDLLFEQNRELVESLMSFVADHGRLPSEDELPDYVQLCEVFGSIRQAFRVVLRVTGDDQWETIKLARAEDLLVYLGLSRFKRRPRWSQLSRSIQLDVKAFFGNYTRACGQADVLLFSLGQRDLLQGALSRSALGKVTGNGLYVHEASLQELPSIVRLFEGCARAYLGTIEGANIIKMHRDRPVVSYLSYPSFDTDPHPALAFSVIVDLQTFRIQHRDYTSSANRPILHRKELFVSPSYPLRERFARLTAQEERAGLLSEPDSIGTEDGWRVALSAKGLGLRGHRLIKRHPQL